MRKYLIDKALPPRHWTSSKTYWITSKKWLCLIIWYVCPTVQLIVIPRTESLITPRTAWINWHYTNYSKNSLLNHLLEVFLRWQVGRATKNCARKLVTVCFLGDLHPALRLALKEGGPFPQFWPEASCQKTHAKAESAKFLTNWHFFLLEHPPKHIFIEFIDASSFQQRKSVFSLPQVQHANPGCQDAKA